jgi:hypothetical protein
MTPAYPVFTELVKSTDFSAGSAVFGILAHVGTDTIAFGFTARALACVVLAYPICRAVVAAGTAIVIIGCQVHLAPVRCISITVRIVLDTGKTACSVVAYRFRIRRGLAGFPACSAVLRIGFQFFATVRTYRPPDICTEYRLLI